MQTCSSNYHLYKTFFQNYFNLDYVFKLQFKSLYEGFILVQHNHNIYVGYGLNQSVSNDIYVYSPQSLSWKQLKNPVVRPSPRYNHVWYKSGKFVYIYGGKNAHGHHLSDIWSIDLDKLEHYQNVNFDKVNNNDDDFMKLAYNIDKTKNNESSKYVFGSTAPLPGAKKNSSSKKLSIKTIIYELQNKFELIPVDDDIRYSREFIGQNNYRSDLHTYRTSRQNKDKFMAQFLNYRYYRNLTAFNRAKNKNYSESTCSFINMQTMKYAQNIENQPKDFNYKKSIQMSAINSITEYYIQIEKIMMEENPNQFKYTDPLKKNSNIFQDLANFYKIYKRVRLSKLLYYALNSITSIYSKSETELTPYLKLPMHDEEQIDGALMCCNGNKFLYVYGGYSHTYTQFSDKIKYYDVKYNMFKEMDVRVKGRRFHVFKYLNKRLYAGFGKRNYPLSDLNVIDLNRQILQTVDFDDTIDYIGLNCVCKIQNDTQNLMIFGGEDGIVISIISTNNPNMKLKKENCLVGYNDKFINKDVRQLIYFHGHLWVRAELTDYENKMLFSITEKEM